MTFSRCFWTSMVIGITMVAGLGTNETENEIEKICSESVYNPDVDIQVIRWKDQTRAMFSCPSGKQLLGQNVTACFVDGNLRKPHPVCLPNVCDFATNMCGWAAEGTWLRENGTIHPKSIGGTTDNETTPTAPPTDCGSVILKSPLFPKDQENRALCFRFSYHINAPSQDTGLASMNVYVEEHFNRSTHLVVPHYKYCNSNLTTGDQWLDETFAVGDFGANDTVGFQIVFKSIGDIGFKKFDLDLCPDNISASVDHSTYDLCTPICELDNEGGGGAETTVGREVVTTAPADNVTDVPKQDLEEGNRNEVNATHIDDTTRLESSEFSVYVWIAVGVFALLVLVAVIFVCARARRRRRILRKEVSDYVQNLQQANAPTSIMPLPTKPKERRRVSFKDIAPEETCSSKMAKPGPSVEFQTHAWDCAEY